ncbi:MAG: hypothetical protein A2Y20_06125 [Firmicutes bacterium GWF2_51_9]|nr:MAG: hypothetical protein A2Y20_06125 [Firmicutes bacterium GWF2_51_9]OGS58019.1 MAG: hypothetical protein A2Y19_05630 [Firmicutes bacterium GWE2_51_13]HBZ42443.1 hypothetical protein [Erysipelotrichaceae bacterium]
MKTARILLYPDEQQEELLQSMVDNYASHLVKRISGSNEGIGSASSLSPSTLAQLERDVLRRRRKSKADWKPITAYCRWGDDYLLREPFLYLPRTQEAFIMIPCMIRPFQKKLLEGEFPPTLTLKKMKKHWFAYLLVDEHQNRE